MRPQAYLQSLQPLLGRPSFTSKEAKQLGISAAVLAHYVRVGKLKRIRRGVYQAVGYQNIDAFRWEDLIEAALSINGGVICLVSALAVYDLTEEIPRQHWIGIRHGTSASSNRLIKIIRFRDIDLGKTKIELEGTFVPIFDRERTLIDAFRLLSRETAVKALKIALMQGGKNRIDLRKLEVYAKRLRVDIAPYLMSIMT